jgi:hypothetical protein
MTDVGVHAKSGCQSWDGWTPRSGVPRDEGEVTIVRVYQ